MIGNSWRINNNNDSVTKKHRLDSKIGFAIPITIDEALDKRKKFEEGFVPTSDYYILAGKITIYKDTIGIEDEGYEIELSSSNIKNLELTNSTDIAIVRCKIDETEPSLFIPETIQVLPFNNYLDLHKARINVFKNETESYERRNY